MYALGHPSPERKATSNEITVDDLCDDHDCEQEDSSAQSSKGPKKRVRKTTGPKEKKMGNPMQGQGSLESFARGINGRARDAAEGVSVKTLERSEEPTLEVDPNLDRRKRRRTVSPALPMDKVSQDQVPQTKAPDSHQQLRIGPSKDTLQAREAGANDSTGKLCGSETTCDHSTNCEERPNVGLSNNAIQDPPPEASLELPAPAKNTIGHTKKQLIPKKRVLGVNKNGKLLSSPTSINPLPEPSTNQKKRRGRKPAKPKLLPTVTVIKYGSDAANRLSIGRKIDDILNGKKPTVPPVIPKPGPLKPSGTSKSTHPFFLGKPAQKKDEGRPEKSQEDAITRAAPTPRKSAVTPGKLRAESRSCHASGSIPAFGPIAGDARLPKHAGLKEAPWPSRDMAHVRNIGGQHALDRHLEAVPKSEFLKARKLKRNPISVSLDEDLIARLSRHLGSATRKNEDRAFGDAIRPESVRLPTRLLTTGVDIQDRLRKEAPTLSSLDNQRSIHPALQTLFEEIEHTLTPFDNGKCETLPWVQKYAPAFASHVLQLGTDALVLREWLQNLTVIAVKNKGDNSASVDAKKPPKKKRKKLEDDFIVPSDEEEDEDMVEISAVGPYALASEILSQPKSLRIPQWSRNKNVVVISGPHGCGKSATVYAVAKELGFEVFELHSGTRRSGKDIQDKVGDMSENHLVNQKRNDTKTKQVPVMGDDTDKDNTDNERMSEALQKDLQSGRQGTMTSFFKSNPMKQTKTKPTPNPKVSPKPTSAPSTMQATLAVAQQTRKLQKQSLILFEEADILFEEDQHFWAQVIRLASQSKRPIVITCNNENSIPMYDLPLAAILRLSPPPTDLATDYLLTLAAREGHVLERKAICNLYKSKSFDLRASISELNFWCQMSVGDRKGGLEWIYQRWPPGKDVDENGRVLRVASQGTYLSGMGMLSHDITASKHTAGYDKEEELLKEAWQGWGVAPDTWVKDTSISNAPSFDELKRLDCMLDSISAADIYCRVGLPSYEHYFEEPADASLPPTSDKDRSNYTIDAPFLQADHASDFTNFDTDLLVQSHLSVQRLYSNSKATLKGTAEPAIPADEDKFTEGILQHKLNAQKQHSLAWPNFSAAFDLLAYPPDASPSFTTSYQLTPSSFDRTLSLIVEDIAPFVRSIVAHELRLEAQRIRLGGLISEGGTSKRPRTTRAARVAQEGGTRETKRRERWFNSDLNRPMVMATAGESWSGMGSTEEEPEASSTGWTEQSLPGSQE
jgi:DNA polymerase III delta prime subunit